jgi:hypothetical protein
MFFSEWPLDPFFERCCRKRMSNQTLFRSAVCLRPRWWRSLHPMDGFLVTKSFLHDVWHCSRDRPFFTLVGVIRNKYIHSFIHRLPRWTPGTSTCAARLIQRVLAVSPPLDLFNGVVSTVVCIQILGWCNRESVGRRGGPREGGGWDDVTKWRGTLSCENGVCRVLLYSMISASNILFPWWFL